MESYIAFLNALRWHLDQLPALLGKQWPEVQANLLRLLSELLAEGDEHRLALRVNRIYRTFAGTQAEPFVRALLGQATATSGDAQLRAHRDGALGVVAHSPTLGKSLLAQAAVVLADAVSISAPVDEAAVPEPEEPDKRINAWLSEQSAEPLRPITIGYRYTLNLNVGKEIAGSLIDRAAAVVPKADLEAGGLRTEWLIESTDFELSSEDSRVTVTRASERWVAKFLLTIPQEGDSEVRRLFLVARSLQVSDLQVVIYAFKDSQRELYRQFAITVPVESAPLIGTTPRALRVRDELICAPAAEMNLSTRHEWTTPPGRLTVTVVTGNVKAAVIGEVPGGSIDGELVDWHAQQANVAGSIANVRDAAEKFRGKWEKYLNDIDPDELLQRLMHFTPTDDWEEWQARADSQHAASWDAASRSSELRNLAIFGHELYETVFPPGSELRTWVDSLQRGYRLDIHWTEMSGPGYVPNVPWGLMYLPDPPAAGNPVDSFGFLGLRFRIGYRAYRGVSAGTKALGAVADTRQAYCLYWGNHPKDETGLEASWQRQLFESWKNRILVPETGGAGDARAELLQMLSAPRSTTVVIYFFCQAAVGDGNQPVLRFGATSGPADVLQTTDLLGVKPLVDQPLIFANACTTSASDPYVANLLEQSLFRRGCRGFLGTETKVPIQLASRFATIFFNFFYRHIDPEPMAAGEALAQTRLFLLSEYANIGGILYTYLNQYELFMADSSEVAALRSV